MQELLIYLLKTSGLMTAFFLAYHLLLRKETFFTGNRWFLLYGLVASALLPLFFITKIVYVEHPKLSIADLIALSKNATPTSVSNFVPPVESIDWFEIACYGYGVVVLLLLLKVCITLFSIIKIVKNKAIQKENSFFLIDLNKDITPFSFFNYIVFNSSLYSTEELENILLHEKVHSQQRHSIDVLVAHLFAIVFWINPIVWFYKKAIIQNLEFIADNNAIQQIEDKKAYQKVLLKVVSHQNCLPITNHFYQSLIKKRIVMLNKNQSHRRNSWKYTVVLPALIAFVFLFQIKVEAQEKIEKSPSNAVSAIAVGYSTDKYATDEEMKNDSKTLKAQLGIDYTFSNVKRNDKGEIIAIKIEYKTKEGKTGKIELDSENPIEPIYFNADGNKVGFSKNGFNNSQQDNSNTLAVSYDEAINTTALNKNKETNATAVPNNSTISFVTQNANNDDVVVIRNLEFTGIKVPGEPTLNINSNLLIKIDDKIIEGDSNKIINNLNPNEIESINVLKDEKAVKYYGDKGKNGVIIIVTKKYYNSKPYNNPEIGRVEMELDSKDPDDGWYSLTNEFKSRKITTEVSNIKRNKDDKIIAIDIVMKSADGRVQRLSIDRTNPIKGIQFFVDNAKNKNWDFGVKELDHEVN